MSFEGSMQLKCESGHYTEMDIYDYYDAVSNPETRSLCRCGGKFVWHNLVDETNGDDEGRVSLTPIGKDEHGILYK